MPEGYRGDNSGVVWTSPPGHESSTKVYIPDPPKQVFVPLGGGIAADQPTMSSIPSVGGGRVMTAAELARQARFLRFLLACAVLGVLTVAAVYAVRWVQSYETPELVGGVRVYDAAKINSFGRFRSLIKSKLSIVDSARIEGGPLFGVAVTGARKLTVPDGAVSSEVGADTLSIGNVTNSRIGGREVTLTGRVTNTTIHAGKLINHGSLGDGNNIVVSKIYAQP